jgi:hypothetical protein
MNRLATTILLAVVLAAGACGAAPEPTAETQSALVGQSVPPAGYSWNSYSQPWVCAGAVGTHPAWNPMSAPWPLNTTNSWCQWMPTPNGANPWNVDFCWAGGTPNGAVDIYSNTDYTGSCARLYGLSASIYGLGHDAPFSWNADLVEANGWHSTWTPPGGTPQFQGIKSMIIGPQTDLLLCEGPFTGPGGAPCNAYRAEGFHIGPNQVGYPGMIGSNGLFFETAALRVNANN